MNVLFKSLFIELATDNNLFVIHLVVSLSLKQRLKMVKNVRYVYFTVNIIIHITK